MSKLIIFTDLDGTLLDHYSYSAEAALAELASLKVLHIPCIINTSKTYAELLELRKELQHDDPFIVENGAAVYLPLGAPIGDSKELLTRHNYRVKALGPTRQTILSVLEELVGTYQFSGFNHLSDAEVMELTGLTAKSARLAKQREFTEPLVWKDSLAAFKNFTTELSEAGLQAQRGGRFVHVMGESDKAKALLWVSSQYRNLYKEQVVTVALGDGQNDIGMIASADIGVVVRSPAHAPPNIPNRSDAWLTESQGPTGWAESIRKVLKLHPQGIT